MFSSAGVVGLEEMNLRKLKQLKAGNKEPGSWKQPDASIMLNMKPCQRGVSHTPAFIEMSPLQQGGSDASSLVQWMEIVKTAHVPGDEGVAATRFAEGLR